MKKRLPGWRPVWRVFGGVCPSAQHGKANSLGRDRTVKDENSGRRSVACGWG